MAKTVNLAKLYKKELVSVLNKNDLEAFRNHCKRWSKFLPPIPDDKTFEIAFYKTMCNTTAVYPKLRKQAKQWLIDKGYNPRIE